MAKNPKEDQIDKDLQLLYTRASKTHTECPECRSRVEIGGDFSEMARAMELRIKYEAIKRSKGGTPVPSFFEDDKEESK